MSSFVSSSYCRGPAHFFLVLYMKQMLKLILVFYLRLPIVADFIVILPNQNSQILHEASNSHDTGFSQVRPPV